MAGVRCLLLLMVLMCVCFWGYAEAGAAKSRRKPQRPPPKKTKTTPLDDTQPAQNIDLQQMGGTWYLHIAASKCSHLREHGSRVEPTVITISPPLHSTEPMTVSTRTRHNHQCWEIKQAYSQTNTPGRLKIKGLRPELDTDVVIGDTDYSSYAIIYYQKRGQVTVKFYQRSVDTPPEPILEKYEMSAERKGMSLAYLVTFPTTSYCDSVDEDHIINCVPTC